MTTAQIWSTTHSPIKPARPNNVQVSSLRVFAAISMLQSLTKRLFPVVLAYHDKTQSGVEYQHREEAVKDYLYRDKFAWTKEEGVLLRKLRRLSDNLGDSEPGPQDFRKWAQGEFSKKAKEDGKSEEQAT